MRRICFIVLLNLVTGISFGQYNWSLKKDNNGIKVYTSEVKNSVFKAIKVECNLTGSYSKLIATLSDISNFSSWVYHSKFSKVVQQYTPLDFVYHTETEMPWPLSNRDAVIHLKIITDSLPKFLAITGNSESGLLPKTDGKVRVTHFIANWKVTMVNQQTIHIQYQIEVDPGGSIPGWIANMFVDKGPYETFSSLSDKLKK